MRGWAGLRVRAPGGQAQLPLPEAAAWAAVILVALLPRLAALVGPPLDLEEARLALLAAEVARGLPQAGEGSPLVTGLVALSLFLFGPLDAAARLPVLLLGLLAVGAAALWRGVLGRWGALLLGLLLALDPAAVHASVRLSGHSAALLGALLLVPGLASPSLLAPLGAALLLLAGPAGWLGLGAVLLARLLAGAWPGPPGAASWTAAPAAPSRGVRPPWALPFLGALLLGATALLLNPLGLQALLETGAQALLSLRPWTRLEAIRRGAILLVGYELGPLLLAAAAAALGLRSPAVRFGRAWAAAGLLLAPPSLGPGYALVLPALPLLVLAALAVERGLQVALQAPPPARVGLAGGLLALAVGFHELLRAVEGVDAGRAALGLAWLLLPFGLSLAVRARWGEAGAMLAGLGPALVGLAALQLLTVSRLAQPPPAGEVEPLSGVEAGHELVELGELLARVQLSGGRVAARGPLPPELGWLLARLPEEPLSLPAAGSLTRQGEDLPQVVLSVRGEPPSPGYLRRELAVRRLAGGLSRGWPQLAAWLLYRRMPSGEALHAQLFVRAEEWR